nr:Chain B, Histone deacetylase 1 [Homo sapiens]7SMF_D Chain D, Histone deacetylase 1 [Homo sapiens]
DIYCYEEFSD